MPSSISYETALTVSHALESALFGVMVVVYPVTMYLIIKRAKKIVKYTTIVLMTVMFALCAIHVGITYQRMVNVLLGPGKPEMNYSRLKSCVHVSQVVIGDFLVVSRSFLLWDRNYLIIATPLLLAVGTFVTGTGALVAMFSNASVPTLDFELQPWTITFMSLTLATKMVCLLLIAFRMGQIQNLITYYVNRHTQIYTLLVVFIESGAVALIFGIALFPTFAAQDNMHYIVWDALSPVTGITVCSIISGIAMQLSKPAISLRSKTWSTYVPPSPNFERPADDMFKSFGAHDNVFSHPAPSVKTAKMEEDLI